MPKVAPCRWCSGEIQVQGLDPSSLLDWPMRLVWRCDTCGFEEIREESGDE